MIRKPESPAGQITSLAASILSLCAATVAFVALAMVPKVDGYPWQDVKLYSLDLLVPVLLTVSGLFLFWFGTPDDIDPHKRRMRLLVFDITVGVLFGLPTLSWLISLTHLAVTGSWRFR